MNPNYPDVGLQRRELQEAAGVIGQQIHVVNAGVERDIDTAFATLVQQKSDALLVANDPFFFSRRDQIVKLAERHAIAAIYSGREFVAAGGLVSYGPNLAEDNRQAAMYVGKILDGAKPADPPVLQPTKVELVINLKTAKALGHRANRQFDHYAAPRAVGVLAGDHCARLEYFRATPRDDLCPQCIVCSVVSERHLSHLGDGPTIWRRNPHI